LQINQQTIAAKVLDRKAALTGGLRIFLFGFAKKERENIEDDELATLRDVAKAWFAADAKAIERALSDGSLQEVEYDKEKED